MSETSDESTSAGNDELEAQRQEIVEVEDELDAQSSGEGLAAEAGRGEEAGLAEG